MRRRTSEFAIIFMTAPGNAREPQQDEPTPLQGAIAPMPRENQNNAAVLPRQGGFGQGAGLNRMRNDLEDGEDPMLLERRRALAQYHQTRRPNKAAANRSNHLPGDIMKLPIEKVVEELVARGYHAGVIARMSEWYNRALLAKCYREKLRK